MSDAHRRPVPAAVVVLGLVVGLAPVGVAAQPRGIAGVCPPGDVRSAGFRDTVGNAHEAAIDCLADLGITGGVAPGVYDPDASVRRDQLASFLARLLERFDVELPAQPPQPFSDVDPGSVHALRIDQLAAIGVVGGHADGTYRPGAVVRRDQMASFLLRALKVVNGASPSSAEDFFDDDDGNVHESSINALAAAGVVAGVRDRRYAPAESVRRDQMASFLMRLADFTTATSVVLQVGNELPKANLQTEQSGALADNRIGSVAETEHVGEWVWNAGLKWMRVIVDPHGSWQHVDWEKDEYAIDPQEESVIDNLVSNGVKIMLVLDVWHPDERTVFHKTEEDIALYLNWVRFMARHLEGRIEYYEILNEPDLNFEAPSGMPVDAYVNLVKRTVPVIREEDPQAKIVVGAVPDTRFDHVRDWMWGLLDSDVMPLVDGVSWHGMYGAAPSDDPRGVRDPEAPQMASYWENYPALVEEIKRTAASNGFAGEYLVEEMLWRTPTPQPESWGRHESEPYGFTDLSAAKYYARAVIIHLGLDVTTGLAVVPEDVRPRSHSVVRALSTVMAGAQAVDLPVAVESEATNIRHYGFALPDGDKLLAVWTDGPAVDDDPGLEATLTFPGVSSPGMEVTGLDVLHGFEQTLSAETDNGDLVVRDLLIRDYPVILRLER